MKETIKKEIKALKLGVSFDSVLAAGNKAKILLLKRVIDISIDKLIEKVLNKTNYVSLNTSKFSIPALDLENQNINRIERLKQTRSIIFSKESLSSQDQAFKIIEILDSSHRIKVNYKELTEILAQFVK